MSVLSAARNADAPLDVLAVNAASAALAIASVPNSIISEDISFTTAARVALVGPSNAQECIPFPSDIDVQKASLSLFVAVNGNGNVLAMSVNTRVAPVAEKDVLRSLRVAIDAAVGLQPTLIAFQNEARALYEREGRSAFPPQIPSKPVLQKKKSVTLEENNNHQMRLNTVYKVALEAYDRAFVECRVHPGKAHRAAVMTRVQQDLIDKFVSIDAISATGEDHHPREGEKMSMSDVMSQLSKASREAHRITLVRDGRRIDGRQFNEVRPIRCETGVLPGDVHGSALFERGDTQVLACSTFGHKNQVRRTEAYLDSAGADVSAEAEGFFVHYTFPPFATGEYGRFAQSQNRREIGHSLLTERAISPLLGNIENSHESNNEKSFPYALRVSADVLGSDGSSSMASVCAGSMAIMDAGAPLREHVAGIAMGLVSTEEGGDVDSDVILTDILGAEDHFGDMDMKVAGTAEGITACQLDVKRSAGLSVQTIERVLKRARIGRATILDEMRQCGLEKPREMAESAPRMVRVPVNRERAKNTLYRNRFRGLRAIGLECEAYLSANDNGDEILVEAPNKLAAEKAEKLIKEAVKEIRTGDVMTMKVAEVRKTFAKVEDPRGLVSGLLHVSKMMLIDENADSGVANMIQNENGSEKENKSSIHSIGFGFPSSYPDMRRLLAVGDEVMVRVIESDEIGQMVRFQLVKRPQQQEERLALEIDSIFNAVKVDNSS